MSASDLIAVVAIVALASMVQGISGFGFALVSMPLLSAVIGVERALAVQTIWASLPTEPPRGARVHTSFARRRYESCLPPSPACPWDGSSSST